MSLTLVPPRKGRSPNWRIRGTVRGVYIDETTGTADRELADAIRIKREGRLLNESVFGPRVSRTFAEAAIGYIEAAQPKGLQRDYIIGRRRKKDGSLSPCLITDFGTILVDKIDQEAVNAVIRRRWSHAKPNTIERNFLTPLIAVLRYAARQKWCDAPMFERPKYDDRRRRWATFDEADRLLAAIARHTRPIVLFLMLTGARVSEAIDLDWSDVSLSERWAVLRRTKRTRASGEKEDRGVPLHPQLVAVLANLPGERKERVFLTQRGKPYIDRERREGGQIATAWRNALTRTRIADLHPHDLRHSFSTWLTMAGVHEQVRDEIMGHASTSMGRRYAHIPRPEALAAVDRLAPRGVGIDMRPRRIAQTKAAMRMRALREKRTANG